MSLIGSATLTGVLPSDFLSGSNTSAPCGVESITITAVFTAGCAEPFGSAADPCGAATVAASGVAGVGGGGGAGCTALPAASFGFAIAASSAAVGFAAASSF